MWLIFFNNGMSLGINTKRNETKFKSDLIMIESLFRLKIQCAMTFFVSLSLKFQKSKI